MDEWLEHVAQAIVNARTMIAGDVIIGGEAAQYLDDGDIADLRARVERLSPFGTDRFVLRKSLRSDHQDAVGAALRPVEAYLEDICGK